MFHSSNFVVVGQNSEYYVLYGKNGYCKTKICFVDNIGPASEDYKIIMRYLHDKRL